MASQNKRKKLTPDEQEKLISDFLNELDDERFLGNEFIGDNDDLEDDCMDESVHEQEDVEEEEEEHDEEEQDEVEQETDFTVEVAPIPRKQKFMNLEGVCNEANYENLPPQNKKTYIYQNAKKTITMKYSTVKEESRPKKRQTNNILRNAPGPRREAKRAKTPLEGFELFITRQMLEKIVIYTNKNIDTFLEDQKDLIDGNNKYSSYKRVDLLDIRAFVGILYLRAAFQSNGSKNYLESRIVALNFCSDHVRQPFSVYIAVYFFR